MTSVGARRTRRALVAAVGVSTLALLVGCSSDGGTSSSGTHSSATPGHSVSPGPSGSGNVPGSPGTSNAPSSGHGATSGRHDSGTGVVTRGSGPEGSGSGGSKSGGSGSGGPRTCATSQLRVALGQHNGAAGSVQVQLVFTNTSKHTCTMYGYPGVSFVTGDSGKQVGSPAKRTGQKPGAVTLHPGQAAHAPFLYRQVGNYPQNTCKPVSVRGLRVYPPDQTAAVFVPLQVRACSAEGVAVPGISPVQPGTH